MIHFVTRKRPPTIGAMEIYAMKLSEALRLHESVNVIALQGRVDGSPPSVFSLAFFGVRIAATLVATRSPRGTVHVADMALWPLALVARLRSRH